MDQGRAKQIARVVLSEFCGSQQDAELIQGFIKDQERGGKPTKAAKEIAKRVLTLKCVNLPMSEEVREWVQGLIAYVADTAVPPTRRHEFDKEGTILVSKESLKDIKTKLTRRRELWDQERIDEQRKLGDEKKLLHEEKRKTILERRKVADKMMALEQRVATLNKRLSIAAGQLTSINRRVNTAEGPRRMNRVDWARWIKERAEKK